jgi:dTDP-4-amino-4,6-dideoxygalactose transaminase
MNEIQAAVGCVQVDKIDMLTEKRRAIGHKITAGLQGIKGITTVYEPKDCKHVFHLYTICVEEKELGATRDEFMKVLYEEEGIQTILHYQPTYHFTGLQKMGYDQNQCPHANAFFYKRETNLPMHPRLTDADVENMITGIRNAAEKVRKKK